MLINKVQNKVLIMILAAALTLTGLVTPTAAYGAEAEEDNVSEAVAVYEETTVADETATTEDAATTVSLESATIEGVQGRYAYTGSAIKPAPVITVTAEGGEAEALLSSDAEDAVLADNNEANDAAAEDTALTDDNEEAADAEEVVLVEGVDYTIKYLDSNGEAIDAPLYPGEYQIVIEGISPNYTGTMTVPYEIFMAMGWRLVDGNWYYYKAENTMLKNGWARDSKGCCWLGGNGKITKSTWLKDCGQWYYLLSNGYMAANQWVKSGSNWYYMKSGGAMANKQWIKSGSNWYYINAGGAMASSQWIKSGSNWYYMKSNGAMASGEWVKSDGYWYYMKSGGAMAAGEWVKSNGSWYYITANGKMATNQFAKDSSGWYWMNSNGQMTSSKMGCPYVWGAAGPNAFDCSGFTMYMMRQRGIYLPHNAAGQYYALSSKNIGTNWHNAQPGDLVFYSYGGPGSSHHVGIYVGNGQLMHASSSHGRVGVTSVTYTNGHIAAICRP